MTNRTLLEKLNAIDACPESIVWLGKRDLATAWSECENGTWMDWLVGALDLWDNDTRQACLAAIVPAQKAYLAARATAQKAYLAARVTAMQAYYAAIATVIRTLFAVEIIEAKLLEVKQ